MGVFSLDNYINHKQGGRKQTRLLLELNQEEGERLFEAVKGFTVDRMRTAVVSVSKDNPDESDRTCTEQSTVETTVKIFDPHAQQIGELKGMVEGLICQKSNIRLALFELSREEYRFVELKYFQRMKVDGIVRELKRSRRSFYRLGDKVLEKLGKRLGVGNNGVI